MPATSTGTPGVKRVATSRGNTAAPPARSNAPAQGTNAVKGSNAVKPSPAANNNAVKPSPAASSNTAKTGPAVKKSPPSAPVGAANTDKSGAADNNGANAKRNPAVGSGAPVGGGTAGGSGTAGRSGAADKNASKSSSTTKGGPLALKFEDAEKEAVKAVFRLKKEVEESYKTKCNDCNSSNSKEYRYGGRFLHNRRHIEHQRLFEVAQEAPKGAHLHIHLNACLEPAFLLKLAASEELKHNMYISVDLQDPDKRKRMKAKLDKADAEAEKVKAATGTKPPVKVRNTFAEPLTKDNIDTAKFQFHFMEYDWKTTCSLFDSKYCGRYGATEKAEDKTYDVMKFTEFLDAFDTHIKKDSDPKPSVANAKAAKYDPHKRCMGWLIKKLVFQESEVVFTEDEGEKAKQTEPAAIARQWALFNTRTQMMKGLFVAETAYRQYLRALFSSFDKDKIQYAELRPNFMAANSVIYTSKPHGKLIKNDPKYPKGYYAYDPKNTMDNREIMKMIIDEFQEWQGKHPKATFKSIKVIMCTPRSPGYPIRFIRATVQECFKMKQEDDFKPWIAGFDFVGPEHEGRMLSDLADDFATWVPEAKRIGLKWILHCGESYYDKDVRDKDGKVKEGNLKFALNHLEPHRLAHGYAIKNAKLSENNKKRLREKCCIETCPSSNEILGLAYDASCAAVHSLRKEKIPCSVSCDNPTLFHSTLSHEFYQVMVGDPDFGLLQWKRLMTDSLAHSVWNDGDGVKETVMAEWRAQYEKFVYKILTDFSKPKKTSQSSS